MRFNVRSLHLLDFYWENFDLLPKALKVILKLFRLHDRACDNALGYEVQTHEFRIDGLSPGFDGYRILHLSDLHIDEIRDGGERLSRIVSKLDFDLCVITGDFRFETYGSSSKVIERMAALMPALECAGGVIGILGNHDFIEMVPDFEAMGIRMLLNESLPVERENERFWLAGLDDAHYYHVDDIEHAMSSIDSTEPVVLLVHSPEAIEQAESKGVSLYLCGHTHGGQVCLPGRIPIIGNARCSRNKLSGRWQHGHMQGYTHRGTGASGIPVRINCPPDISIHRLIAA